RIHPDIVHLNGFAHGALPWRSPALVVGHSCVLSWREAVGGEIDPAWLAHYRESVMHGLRAADWVVAPSGAMLATLQRLYGPFRVSSTIPNGRDSSRFRPREKEPFIFSAGRLWDRAKNLDALKRIE